MNKIDLHVHTTASDGKKTPEEIVDWAIEKKIPAITIADHDTIAGSKIAQKYAKDKNIELITGIEVGCSEQKLTKYDLHVVGLFIDLENKELVDFTKKMQKSRVKQKTKMIERLNTLGYNISLDELKKEAGEGSYGKPHLAHILFRKNPDKFKTYRQVFDELLGTGRKADISREGVYNLKDSIELIHNAGGLAILAHPGFLFEDAEQVIDLFVKLGGDGIEADYDYSGIGDILEGELVNKFRKIAKEKNLLISGGTDFHSTISHKEIGEHGITQEELNKLKKRIN